VDPLVVGVRSGVRNRERAVVAAEMSRDRLMLPAR